MSLLREAGAGVVCEVPAKVMLFGEYSVLEGGSSLAMTLGYTMKVAVTKTRAPGISVTSDLWDKGLVFHGIQELVRWVSEHPGCQLARTVLNASRYFGVSGFNVQVKSGWEVSDGMGSSSAMRLGVWKGLSLLRPQQPVRDRDLLTQIWQDQTECQGFGSGYDLATQYTGGLVRFRFDKNNWPLVCEKIPSEERLAGFLHIYRGGRGAPTRQTGKKHLHWLKQNALTETWFRLQEEGGHALASFIASKYSDPDPLISTVDAVRQLWSESPVFPVRIRECLAGVEGLGRSWSYKTTGAGGEDAVVLFGHKKDISGPDRALTAAGWSCVSAPYPFKGLIACQKGTRI